MIRPTELFSLSALLVTVFVGCLLNVVEFGRFIGLPLVWLVAIYIVWITANYFFEIIEFKAFGNREWPVMSLETLVAGRNQIGIGFALLVMLVLGLYVALDYYAYDSLAELLLVAALLALPGMLALLAVTRAFSAALNPFRILAASFGLGHTYFYCLAGAGGSIVMIWLAESRGGLWYFPLVYGLFVYAYLIGTSVYARRNVLGVVTPKSPEARAERAKRETVAIRNGILSHAYGFAAHGNRAGALRYIDSYIEREEDTLEARLWMLEQTMRWEDAGVALALGRRLIDYCEAQGLAEEADRVRLRCEQLASHREKGALG